MEPDASASPYAPPRAAVADVETGFLATEPPRQMVRAIKLLWLGFGVGVLIALFRLVVPAPRHLSTLAQFCIDIAIFLILYGFNTMIARGHNWARILYLIFTVISVLGIPLIVFSMSIGATPTLDGVVSLFQFGLGFYICYLLFTRPSREWFHAMKASR